MEKRGFENRLKGIRNVAAATAFSVAFIAGCSLTAEATKKPTITPDITPAPSLVIPSESPIATPEATPTATPEPTPTPTPEATAKPITSIIEGKHSKVSTSKISSDIDNAFSQNPEAEGFNEFTLETAKELWKLCQKGEADPQGDPIRIKFDYCKDTVFQFYNSYQGLGDINFYNTAKDAYNYTVNKFPQFKSNLDSYLEQTLQ